MREKSKAAEDKMAQLMEDYSASKAIWDKEVALEKQNWTVPKCEYKSQKNIYLYILMV